MSYILRDLIARLAPDPWREQTPFSPSIGEVHEQLWRAESDQEAARILGDWLQSEQPCLFGRVAAQRDLITFCIITAVDVASGDTYVRDKIQSARTQWSADAFNGRRSGFVIALISRELAMGTPDDGVARLAARLCELYLLCEVELDTIYTDKVRLEVPTHEHPTWQWEVGVNYFSAHADRRWWHDHRIPGGIALSMNSVGHMVKSTAVAQTVNVLKERLGLTDPEMANAKLDDLNKALRMAMMTINRAQDTTSGPATRLLPLDGPASLPPCPITLPKELTGKNYCEYVGFYHTDVTLPSVYFRTDEVRPPDVPPQPLDFTYLFDDSFENPDWIRMGTGVRIRAQDDGATVQGEGPSKRRKAHATTVKV